MPNPIYEQEEEVELDSSSTHDAPPDPSLDVESDNEEEDSSNASTASLSPVSFFSPIPVRRDFSSNGRAAPEPLIIVRRTI